MDELGEIGERGNPLAATLIGRGIGLTVLMFGNSGRPASRAPIEGLLFGSKEPKCEPLLFSATVGDATGEGLGDTFAPASTLRRIVEAIDDPTAGAAVGLLPEGDRNALGMDLLLLACVAASSAAVRLDWGTAGTPRMAALFIRGELLLTLRDSLDFADANLPDRELRLWKS